MTHRSVQATYDSRETGPRYHVTTAIDGKTISFRQLIDDPFVRQTVTICWRDLLRGLLRRRLVVEVTVGADIELIHDVLELDDNTLIEGRTRKTEFRKRLVTKMGSIFVLPEEKS